ncbi:MAG: lysophospholipid acyltransferase family protein [Gemmatimonadales bacterium]|nr:lysophospholipid acyltransferase family protein [Gemmatimonadales bacterium]
MKWRLGPEPTARLAGPILSGLARTWRVETRAAEHWRTVRDGGRGFLFLLWHEALLPLLWHHQAQGIAIVVSEATDGRYLAAYASRLGYRNLLGSSTRGGVRALIGAVRALEGGTPVAFTPDGPRGPRRVLKPGILAAAERAAVPILPIHAEADRAWRLSSWDRFVVPKPFARIRIGYGAPFMVGGDPEGHEADRIRAEAALADIEREIAWRHGGATDTG